MRNWNPAFRFRTIAITQSTIKIFLLRISKKRPWLELRPMLVLLFQYGRSGKLPQHAQSKYFKREKIFIKMPNIVCARRKFLRYQFRPVHPQKTNNKDFLFIRLSRILQNFFSGPVQVEHVLKHENVLLGV